MTALMAFAAVALAAHHAPAQHKPVYAPMFDPGAMVAGITNPYLPLKPGSEFRFFGTGKSRGERTTVTVTSDTRKILGIDAVVVHEQAFRDSALVEDTFDWYAQDKAGNVWYLGEATKEMRAGKVVSTEGSWQAGVKGAKPGIAMPADPAAQTGKTYRQEYLPGVAEDMGTVVAMHKSAKVSAATFPDCVETLDTSPLEPKARESKMYCRGVGLVRETDASGGGSELYLIMRKGD